jgi:hypothetical protein
MTAMVHLPACGPRAVNVQKQVNINTHKLQGHAGVCLIAAAKQNLTQPSLVGISMLLSGGAVLRQLTLKPSNINTLDMSQRKDCLIIR